LMNGIRRKIGKFILASAPGGAFFLVTIATADYGERFWNYSYGHFEALAFPGVDWWFTLHMIQTPMVALVSIGLWLLASRVVDEDGLLANALAWLSRLATLVFVIYYTALDSIGGFGLGRTIINTQTLKAAGKLNDDQISGVILVLNTTWVDPWVGGVGSFISLTGSWAVFIASALLALALLLAKKAPWPALILLVAFGWELQTSHTMPYGPIAFGLLIVAALWMVWAEHRAAKTALT
jgi:hypothetical protein